LEKVKEKNKRGAIFSKGENVLVISKHLPKKGTTLEP